MFPPIHCVFFIFHNIKCSFWQTLPILRYYIIFRGFFLYFIRIFLNIYKRLWKLFTDKTIDLITVNKNGIVVRIKFKGESSVDKQQLIDQIQEWKEKKNAVILAHYYVDDDVQAIADYVGDSYYLAKVAVKEEKDMICFAGVKFMGESAKILNPEKTVVMPDGLADCDMAHMVDINKIKKIREEYDDLAVACYINSTAEIKSYSDVCVTSANALKIIKALPQKNIFFIPDENLGRYIDSQVPEKNFIFNDGYCPVHKAMSIEEVKAARAKYPEAEILVHPECTMDVVEMGDYVGSTSGIINYATNSDKKEFIICTELGVLYELKKKNPDKVFYGIGPKQICADMKKVTLENVLDAIKNDRNQVELEEELSKKAKHALDEMLRLAK